MEYLAHHGTKGMKWGVRRYQNPDGSLTAEGRKRYGVDTNKYATENVKEAGRRSAKASAKASFKGNIKRSAALSVAGAALGAASLGSASIGALPLIGAAAGSAFVADMATNTALGAIMGRTQGRKAAHQQDLEIRNHVKNGESFVLDKITATATSKTTWYGNKVKIKTTSEKMRSDKPDDVSDKFLQQTRRAMYTADMSRTSPEKRASGERYAKTLSPIERASYNSTQRSLDRDFKKYSKKAQTNISKLSKKGYSDEEIAAMLKQRQKTVDRFKK